MRGFSTRFQLRNEEFYTIQLSKKAHPQIFYQWKRGTSKETSVYVNDDSVQKI